MHDNTILIVAAAIIVILALLILFLVKGRKQNVTFGNTAPPPRATPPVPTAPAMTEAEAEMADLLMADGGDMTAGIGLAPVAAEVMPDPTMPADPLTRLKGLGPKAAAKLNELGITRFDQIASWDEAQATAIDAQMGPFKGRIARDRWIDQARLLASGDTTAFETEFGKLGG